MKRLISVLVIIGFAVSLAACSGIGTIAHGGYAVYLKDGSVYHNVKWYKSRTEGIAFSERPTGTVMFLTEDYGLVEVPWENVERIQTETR